MFYFKLHPLQWQFESDAITVYRALELANGNYLVSWESQDGRTTEVLFTKDEVNESLEKHHWLVEE